MIKVCAFCLALAVPITALWFALRFRPLMPAGHAVQINTGKSGEFDYQVWQRKNKSTFEPFATGLFIHRRGEPWRVFLLDFEDEFRPRVELKTESTGIAVIENRRVMGILL